MRGKRYDIQDIQSRKRTSRQNGLAARRIWVYIRDKNNVFCILEQEQCRFDTAPKHMFVYLCSRPANRHSLMAGFMADAHINIDYSAAM